MFAVFSEFRVERSTPHLALSKETVFEIRLGKDEKLLIAEIIDIYHKEVI